MKRFSLCCCFLIVLSASAQPGNAFLNIEYGTNHVFRNWSGYRPGFNVSGGIHYVIPLKGRTFFLDPGLQWNHQVIDRKLSEQLDVKLSRSSIGLELDVLSRVSRNLLCRIGLGGEQLYAFMPEVWFKQAAGSVYGFSNSVLKDELLVSRFVCHINAGVSFEFRSKRNKELTAWRLNIKIREDVVSPVRQDYRSVVLLPVLDDVIFSAKDLPTHFLLGVDMNLHHLFSSARRKAEMPD